MSYSSRESDKNRFFHSLRKKFPEYEGYIDNIQKNNRRWDELRNEMINSKNYEEAVELGKIYFYKNKRHAGAYAFLARTYEETDNHLLALETYEEGIRETNNTVALFSNYIKLSEKSSPKNKVIELYRGRINKYHDISNTIGFIKYLISKKYISEAENETVEAIKYYKGKSPQLGILLSEVYYKSGNLEKSKAILVEQTEKYPRNIDSWKNLYLLEKKMVNDTNNLKIIRTIEFEPEYHTSGIAILQNFGKLLRDKYGKLPVKVEITQEDLVVKMVVTPPHGKKVEVEEYLYKYGLVLKGDIQPEEFLNEPIHIMELKTELKMAQTRIELQREQMEFLSNHNSSRILSLEEEVNWLRRRIANSLDSRTSNFSELLGLLQHTNQVNENLVQSVVHSLESKNVKKLKNLMLTVKEEEPLEYNQLKTFISNTISSTSANTPAWIELLSRVF